VIKKILSFMFFRSLGLAKVIAMILASTVSLAIFGIILCMFFLWSLETTSIFAGIVYPKKQFMFVPIYEEGEPPGGSSDRLNAGAAYPQPIIVYIRKKGPNHFEMFFATTIFVNKPYDTLHIKEMSYEWEGNTGVFVKEQNFKIFTNRYVTNDNWYWYNKLGGLPDVNFEKLFRNKKIGDEFKFSLKFVYSFDEEPENLQCLDYNVEVYKGEYFPSPWF